MATVDIPVAKGEAQRLNCVFKQTTPPSFRLVFPPHTLEMDRIAMGTDCRLIVKMDSGSINLNIKIDAVDGDRALLCTAMESISPEALREYFRVMISAPIRARYVPGPNEVHEPWELEGHTIDLSGGGVLALFSGKPANINRIQLELYLPGQASPVRCTARVVRTYRMRKNRYQVAFSFVTIERKARDLIISCCLQEQRRQLRDKVRVE